MARSTLAIVSTVLLLSSNTTFPQTPPPAPRMECNGLTGADLAKCVSDTPGNRNNPAERNRTGSEDPRRKSTPPPSPTVPEVVQPPGSPPGINPPPRFPPPPTAPSR